MHELTLEASVKNIPKITAFVEEKLNEMDCPLKARMQIVLAIDEMYANISMYAYDDKKGLGTVRLEKEDEPKSVTLTFIDEGKPYDPTKKEDPDISLPADQRPIGGLGIFIVKKVMDEVGYEYKDGKNILRLKKYL